MNKFKLFYLLLAAPLILSVSCSKDEPEPEKTYIEPVASSRTNVVDMPTGLQNSTDPYAALASSWIQTANGLAAYGSSFSVPGNAQIGGDKSSGSVYFWTLGDSISYWMTFTELVDKYTWKYEFASTNVPRFTHIEAEELKTGKEGSWTIFSPVGNRTIIWDYNWEVNTSNDFSATMMMYGIQTVKYEVLDKADNSGYFKAFISEAKFVDII